MKIFYAKESIPDGPEGIILESVLEGMAEYYSANLAQNVKRGMLQNAAQAKPNGGATPFGYSVENKKYLISPTTGNIVKELFTLYSKGESIKTLYDLLNSRQITTAIGNKFSANAIHNILSNEKYIGVYKFDNVRIENAVPKIVDDELFYLVQRQLEESRLRKVPKRQKRTYNLYK